MGKLNEKAELIADRFDLPDDALAGTVKLTVNGRRRVLVENHKGIVSYEDDLIAVDCGSMRINIRGDGLQLGAMDRDDMLILGRLLAIEFE